MKLLLKASKSSGVKTATHGSIDFARTSPPENEGLSFAGSVSRFFASSENSKWPLNAKFLFLQAQPMVSSAGRKVGRSRGVGGAPRLRPVCVSPFCPTFSPFATQCPTYPDDVHRWLGCS